MPLSVVRGCGGVPAHAASFHLPRRTLLKATTKYESVARDSHTGLTACKSTRARCSACRPSGNNTAHASAGGAGDQDSTTTPCCYDGVIFDMVCHESHFLPFVSHRSRFSTACLLHPPPFLRGGRSFLQSASCGSKDTAGA